MELRRGEISGASGDFTQLVWRWIGLEECFQVLIKTFTSGLTIAYKTNGMEPSPYGYRKFERVV
jgi:hypothetical protein